jgi:hypothetical protein
MKDRPNTVAQGDKAPAHASHYQDCRLLHGKGLITLVGINGLKWSQMPPWLHKVPSASCEEEVSNKLVLRYFIPEDACL